MPRGHRRVVRYTGSVTYDRTYRKGNSGKWLLTVRDWRNVERHTDQFFILPIDNLNQFCYTPDMKTNELKFCIECGEVPIELCDNPEEHREDGFWLTEEELEEYRDRVARDTAADTIFEFKRGN